MRDIRCESDEAGCPFSFSEPSYESYVFAHLYHLHLFLESQGPVHAVFGGAAVGAYSGHLPRKLHDIDLIVPEREETELVSHLRSERFREQVKTKTKRASFREFVLEDDRYQIIVSVFPGRFTLLDLADSAMPPIGTYDFGEALKRRSVRPIHALGGDGHVPVTTIPIEDLIITKLWPTVEPNSVYDLILLLASDMATRLDFPYLVARATQVKKIGAITLQTLKRLSVAYDKSLWSGGLPAKGMIKAQVRILIDALDSENVGTPT